MTRRLATGVVLTGVLVAQAGCATPPHEQRAAAAAQADPGTGNGVRYSLYTHCGIRGLMYKGRWYDPVGGNLNDGMGSPPDGWGNPFQPGTLKRTGTSLVFRDTSGHRVVFRPSSPGIETPAPCA